MPATKDWFFVLSVSISIENRGAWTVSTSYTWTTSLPIGSSLEAIYDQQIQAIQKKYADRYKVSTDSVNVVVMSYSVLPATLE